MLNMPLPLCAVAIGGGDGPWLRSRGWPPDRLRCKKYPPVGSRGRTRLDVYLAKLIAAAWCPRGVGGGGGSLRLRVGRPQPWIDEIPGSGALPAALPFRASHPLIDKQNYLSISRPHSIARINMPDCRQMPSRAYYYVERGLRKVAAKYF